MLRPITIAVLALSMGIAAPTMVRADDKHMSPAEREKKLEKMTSDLKLTQDQKNQVRTIKEEKYQKVEAAKKEAHEKIRALLTPEQQGKFDKMIANK
jgi:Spy/CpxP family protein refolding chaperone